MPAQTAEPALTRIDGVELARVGSWGTMLGKWDATATDFAAAIESAACPATRAPIVKLGHLDKRFTPHDSMPTFDGTPSIGWVENLRVDGDVLLGDFAGVPQWLRTVAASAFPNRSIEAAYNRRCALGHVHPFSVGAVALLGVTPPGVDSLRSLNDIPALFGIAAAGCADLDVGQLVVATIGDIAAGRHSLPATFADQLHPRDGWGRFATADGPAPPPPLRAVEGRDLLNLAGQIGLPEGESVASSSRLAVDDSDIAVAWINTPAGPNLRLGVGQQDSDWGATPGDDTASLDPAGVARLAQAAGDAQDAIDRGRGLLRDIDQHIDGLEGERRDLQRRQYPHLNRTQQRQADRLDGQITDLDTRIAGRSRSQQEANADLPATARAEYDRLEAEVRRLGDGNPQQVADLRAQQAALHQQREDPNRPVGYATLTRERLSQLDDATTERARFVEQRDTLLGTPQSLSDADQADLARVGDELAQAEAERADLVDGQVLRGGIIPGVAGGDLVYEVLMGDPEPRVRLEVRPADAGGGWEPGESGVESTFTRSEWAKLVKLLAAGVTTDVAAAADDGVDEPHTGAMVALIPTAEDAARLAVDGGLPVNELHCTLMYLGEADQVPTKVRARLVDEINRAVTGFPAVDASGFSIAAFNPVSTEPCIVLGISGQMADDIHDLVEYVVTDTAANTMLDLPDQHAPWQPHITLSYTAELGRIVGYADLTGPIRFDRIRVVFGGDATDIPLTAAGWGDLGAGDPRAYDSEPVAAADSPKPGSDSKLRTYWTKGKGAAKIRWGEGGDFKRCVTHLGRFVKDPQGLCAEYHHDALGIWPATHAKLDRAGKKVAASDSAEQHPPGEPEPTEPPPTTEDPEPTTPPQPGGVSVPPEASGAEPVDPSETKREDPVSDLSTKVRSRLGLPDDADDAAIEAALDALKVRAETPTPDPEAVAASAAAKAAADEYKAELDRVNAKLNEITVAASADAKRLRFEGYLATGRIAPTERAAWEARYDKAPDVIADILDSRPESFAVPVAASGHAGTGEERFDDAEFAGFFPPGTFDDEQKVG
jgi:2'-5' RNA ligase